MSFFHALSRFFSFAQAVNLSNCQIAWPNFICHMAELLSYTSIQCSKICWLRLCRRRVRQTFLTSARGAAIGKTDNTTVLSRCGYLVKFIFCLGLVWSKDGRKPIHHFPSLVCTETVYTFVEKWWHMLCCWTKALSFSTKMTTNILLCQIDFLIICNLFWSNHFLIRFCFSEIY